MESFVDSVDGGYLVGWAKLKNQEHSIAIDVLINGDPVATNHPANIPRADVQAAGVGHGRYGFSIPIPKLNIENGEIEINIKASDWVSDPIISNLKLNSDDYYKVPAKGDPIHSVPSSNIHIHIDEASEYYVRGWCVDTKDISRIIDIDVLIDGCTFSTIKNDMPRGDLKSKKISCGLGGFKCFLPTRYLDAGEHIVSLKISDGFSKEKTISSTGNYGNINIGLVADKIENVTVIVPIYNAHEDLEICIERLKDYTPDRVDILLIDDASSDPRILEILRSTAEYPNFRYLRNKRNAGFTQTVNRGLAEAGSDDVIILNSDARVTPGWIEGMMLAARSGPKIATVTAMSDRAGAFSAPKMGNENTLPDGVSEIAYARAFRRHSLGLYPAVPTGNGFCMFISRACMNEIGILDVEAFPRGYGEENDFCMRAMRAGWHNIIDDRTYVFHDRSKSFGDAKTDLMQAGRAIVDARYPEYKKAISVFSKDEKINMARFQAQKAAAACQAEPLPPLRILFVVSTQTGGTPQTNRDLMQGLSGDVDGWILRCDSLTVELSHMVEGETRVVKRHNLNEEVDPLSHNSKEYRAVISQWLLGLDPDIVHIRHLGWHGLSLPQIAKNLGMKVVFSFHDYYALCPTVKLLDENNVFCGGTCTNTDGHCRAELWPEGALPELKHRWVHVWRERFAEALKPCDAFITTSDSARTRILKHMPSVPVDRFMVIPHGRDFQFGRASQPPLAGEPLRILVPGNISLAKGLNVIYDLLSEDKAELLEFHVLGDVAPSIHGEHPRLIKHGKYKRENFAQKVSPIRPHVGAIMSVWDETYCHTLTELWSIGVPAIAFDYQTVADRIRRSGAGWVLAHDDIPALYLEILRVGYDRAERSQVDHALIAWQEGEGTRNTINVMAASYLAIYRDILRDAPGVSGSGAQARVAVVCSDRESSEKASVSSYVRIQERTRNHVDRDITYIPMTPSSLLANLKAGTINGAVVQSGAIPQMLSSEVLSAFGETGTPYMFELADNIHDTGSETDAAGFHPSYLMTMKEMLSNASTVAVSTDAVKASLQSVNGNVVVLPHKLSDRLWKSASARPGLKAAGSMHAVYMGTETHDHDLQMIMPALDAVADIYPEFRLTLIGITPSEIVGINRDWLVRKNIPDAVKAYDRFVPWLREQANRFDFAIAPSAETSWSSGFSGFKIFEYAALGLPVIASSIGNYPTVADQAPAVQLAENTPEAWRSALMTQIELREENSRLGELMRKWVIQSHMLQPTLAEFDEIILSMVQ